MFSFALAYGTPTEKLAHVPDIVRAAIESHDRVRFDRAHFQRFGEYGLVFEAVYYVLSADYNLYVGIEQDVNLTMHRRFAEEGIEFAQANRTFLRRRRTPSARSGRHIEAGPPVLSPTGPAGGFAGGRRQLCRPGGMSWPP